MTIRTFAVAAAVAIAAGSAGFFLAGSDPDNVGSPIAALAAEDAGLSDLQKSEVEALIRSYLIANPEIISEAIDALQAKQEAAEAEAQIAAIKDNADLIFDSASQAVLGNPDGDVTLVEFFDYNCGFCKRAMADLQQLMDEDPSLRIVIKEFPVLGEASVEAAQVSAAVNIVAPERYEEFHFALLSERGSVDGALSMAVAEDLGIDVEAVGALIDSDQVRDTINEVYEIASRLNLSGTPTYVTPEEVIVGAVGFSTLQSKISEIRSN